MNSILTSVVNSSTTKTKYSTIFPSISGISVLWALPLRKNQVLYCFEEVERAYFKRTPEYMSLDIEEMLEGDIEQEEERARWRWG